MYQLCSLLQLDKSKQLGRSCAVTAQEHCLLQKEQLLSAVLVTSLDTHHVLGYLNRHRFADVHLKVCAERAKTAVLLDTADGPFPVSYKIPQVSSVFLLPLGQASELSVRLLYAM